MQTLRAEDIAAIRTALLTFFDASARPLPWRETRDPYAVWISEVMAQQTRVETAVPYYQRWLARFPDVGTLAAAPLDDVLKAWEGLGYYARARNLHAAARLLRECHGSAVPRTYEALRSLPGVGEYTAGAVSSIAFGVPRAAVDGNVRRVLARLLDEPAPSPSHLREVAGVLVPEHRPGDFNQALMELGAMICTPKAPRCQRCPVQGHCAAHAAGTQANRPRRKTKRSVPTIDIATAVVRDGARRLLIVRRPSHGLLAGLWSFPGVELQAGDDPAARAAAIARPYRLPVPAAGGGGATSAGRAASPGTDRLDAARPPRPLGLVEHVFSHRRERYHCFVIDVISGAPGGHDTAWIDEDDDVRALPRAQQRIRSMALAAMDRQRPTGEAPVLLTRSLRSRGPASG
jgi:A/G-specific adenine glycosylase